jgi:hypothetical protein
MMLRMDGAPAFFGAMGISVPVPFSLIPVPSLSIPIPFPHPCFSGGKTMPYLQPSDYASYGLPDSTTADWITAATSLINTFCRRPDLNITQYTERLRLTEGSQCARLSYLPLASLADAASPIVSVQARYARPRRGEIPEQPLWDIAWAFALPGQWIALDVSQLDFDPRTGELTLRNNVMGLPYNEIEVTYTAGLAEIGDDIKSA